MNLINLLSPLRLSMRTLLTSTLWQTTCTETWWLIVRTSVSSSGKNHVSFSAFIYASWTYRMWQPKYVTHAKETACFALLYVIWASQLIEFSFCDFTLCVIESNVQVGREWVTKAGDSHQYNMSCEVFCQSWTAVESLRVMIMAGRGAGEQVPPHPFKQLTGREWRFPFSVFLSSHF